jgi:hypothetical protein
MQLNEDFCGTVILKCPFPPAILTSANLLEMQIIELYPRPTESEFSKVRSAICVSTDLRVSLYLVKIENHCCREYTQERSCWTKGWLDNGKLF